MKTFGILASGLIAVSFLGEAVCAGAKTKVEDAPVVGSVPVKGSDFSKYPALARISMVDASRIAKERFPGEISSVALENEDGYLVYAVELVSKSSGHHEILVDAGNGKILADETKGNHAERGEEREDE